MLSVALVLEATALPNAIGSNRVECCSQALAPKSQAEDVGDELKKIRYRLSHRPNHTLGARRQIIDRAHGGRYAIFEISASGVKQNMFSQRFLEGYEPRARESIYETIIQRLKSVQAILAKNACQTIEHPLIVFIVPDHPRPKDALHPHLLDLRHADDRWYASLIVPDFIKTGDGWQLTGIFLTLDLILDNAVKPESLSKFIATITELTRKGHGRESEVTSDIDLAIRLDIARYQAALALKKKQDEQALTLQRDALKRTPLSLEERAGRFRKSFFAIAALAGTVGLLTQIPILGNPLGTVWGNIAVYTVFVILTNALALHSAGREKRLQTFFWFEMFKSTLLGILQGSITVAGFWFINRFWYWGGGAPASAIGFSRAFLAFFITRYRDRLFLAGEDWFLKRIQDRETFFEKYITRNEKFDEAWWSARIPSWGRHPIIQIWVPQEFAVAVEVGIAQSLNMFYQWATNKKGFLFPKKVRRPPIMPFYWIYLWGNRYLYLPAGQAARRTLAESGRIAGSARDKIRGGLGVYLLPYKVLFSSAWENLKQGWARLKAHRLSGDLDHPGIGSTEDSA